MPSLAYLMGRPTVLPRPLRPRFPAILLAEVTFIPRPGFTHPNTRTHVGLLGPCFKTVVERHSVNVLGPHWWFPVRACGPLHDTSARLSHRVHPAYPRPWPPPAMRESGPRILPRSPDRRTARPISPDPVAGPGYLVEPLVTTEKPTLTHQTRKMHRCT